MPRCACGAPVARAGTDCLACQLRLDVDHLAAEKRARRGSR